MRTVIGSYIPLTTFPSKHLPLNSEDPLVKYEFAEIKAAIDFDRNVAANVGWKALVKTPGNRKRMNVIIGIAFFSQWSGNGIASYYLNKILTSINIKDPTHQVGHSSLLVPSFISLRNSSSSTVSSKSGTWLGRSSPPA